MKKTGVLVVLFSLMIALPAYADINSDLLSAAKKCDSRKIRSLLKKGADINEKEPKSGFTALMEAARNDCKNVVLGLLYEGADANAKAKNGTTALMIAAGRGNYKITKALLDHGADANAKTIIQQSTITALSEAAWHGAYEIYELLKQHSAKE